MKYSELVNFSPIETIIQLKDAGNKDKAKNLIESYVMSDEMADKLSYGILNELQFDEVVDNKGVLIVGNYGTGKSHLMSVISAIANDKNNVQYLKNNKFAKNINKIAGRFEVLRVEIGAVSNSLRNIIVSEIENDLAQRGIIYKFPSADNITNNKAALQAMMAAFEEKYPERGYLLVVDELLDYLRTRKQNDLILDLGFLREIGEFIKDSRFRLICGIQEQLFENPAFSFVSKSLNRVKDRFEQIIIRKEDTAYVVSERILGKTPEQKAIIREHLLPFCNLYSEMSERLEDFVELYPIHPSYIDIFNKVYIAEKREVLKTISLTVKNLLDKDVPNDAPGIISFDSYWLFIKDNYARKAEAEIKEVMEKSAVLEDKITRAFPKKIYKLMALQIINALSVHRLTTSGIDVRIGLTAENLKDDLCLYIENMPDMNSETLLSIIQTVLKEITVLVSGQFIELNPDNGQYFLDLKKDVDFDAKIMQKADMLSDNDLVRYFYKLVYDCLEWDEEQYVPNFEIYEYRLNWESHNIYRKGYLFMGVPEERSTAQPPQDFYIYILPPYTKINLSNKKDPDEVMFEFKGDEKFYDNLKKFAASLMMKDLAADHNTKKTYADKAERYRKILYNWLNENKNTCFNVIYKGIKKQLIEITHGKTRAYSNFKDTIDIAASTTLDEYFSSKYPEFPKMKIKITESNQAGIIERTVRYFAGQKAQDSLAFLESFDLINNGIIDVKNSKYTMHLIKKLNNMPPQGVINYSDIVNKKFDDDLDNEFNINIQYYSVVLLALVYCGNANLALRNGTILTASNLDILPKIGLMDIYEFKYLAKPKQASIEELKRLFEILELPTGLIVNPNEAEKGLEKLLIKTNEIAETALKSKNYINDDFVLWGELLIPEHIMDDYKVKIGKALDEFGNFRNRYNTIAKLNNFSMSMEQLDELEQGIKCIKIINEFEIFKIKCESTVNYISNIETMELPNEFLKDIDTAKSKFIELRDNIRDGKDGETAARNLLSELMKIKNSYIEYYFDKHQKCRLGINDARKKGELINSKTLSNLKKLAGIESIFRINKLTEIENKISQLQVCYELTTNELQKRPVCSHCGFKPAKNNILVSGKLEEIENNLDELKEEWTNALLSALEDPLIYENKGLLKAPEQNIIDTFINEKSLPETVDIFFINTFNLLFSELDKVYIEVEDIEKEILNLGPCTVEDLKQKINSFIDKTVKGKDKNKLRIIIKQKSFSNYQLVAEENNSKKY